MPTSLEIYNSIKDYRGTQISAWNPIEASMFNHIVGTFGGWMRSNGMADVTTVDATTVKGWLEVYEATGRLSEGSGSFTEAPSLGSNLIDAKVNCYTIGTLKKLLGAIQSIGTNSNTNSQPYLIKFKNGTLVYLCTVTHYAYPIRIGSGEMLADLLSYNHDYATIMQGAVGTPVDTVIKAINRNTTPAATSTNLDLLTVFVANYICESDRNWMQLLVSLITLGTSINPFGNLDRGIKMTTFKAKANQYFPMGGGGWKNRCSWGGGLNPTATSAEVDSREIKRWFLAIIIDIMRQAPNTSGRVLAQSDWTSWIDALQEDENSRSRKIIKHITDVLNIAVTNIKKVK